jgi:uncharacterized membrane protein HdeD (DUF308 family)
MPADDRSTMDQLRGSRIAAYAVGAILLIAGIVLLFWPDRSLTVVARFIGIFLAVIGLAQAFEAVTTHRKGSYWGLLLLRGLINLGFGLALLFWPSATVHVVVWLVGLDLVLTGIIAFIVSFQVPKEMGRSSFLLQAIVTVVLGVLIMAWPSATLTVISVILAILLILFGLVLLISGYQLSKAVVTIGPEAS